MKIFIYLDGKYTFFDLAKNLFEYLCDYCFSSLNVDIDMVIWTIKCQEFI